MLPQEPITLLHITTVPSSLSFVKQHIPYLRERGFVVSVLSSPGEDLAAFAKTHGVPANAVTMPRRITPLRDTRALLNIWYVLRHTRPQIVHAHTPKGGLLGTIAAWLARVPVRVYHMRGLPYFTAQGYKRRLLVLSEKVSCRLAHQVFCISPSLRTVAIADGLCPADKIKVLAQGSSGVDAVNQFNPTLVGAPERMDVRVQYGIPDHAKVIGFVGRIVRDKGIAELIGAWNVLKDEFPDLHLLLVGPFEIQDPIPEVVERQLKQDSRIHLAGHIKDGLHTIYSLMDVYVFPTHREGFPNTPMEAAAMGIPVVATRIPGCVDAVIDGVTGTLVPPYNAGALVAAVRHYLNDPQLRKQHGEAARARVLRDFQPEAIIEATYQEYLRLLKEKGLQKTKNS